MNMQQRADQRSLALHQAIAQKLRQQPALWDIPRQNLQRWKQRMGTLPLALQEWEHILKTFSRDKTLAILVDSSQNATRLRSSSPFAGVLTEAERINIFQYYRLNGVQRIRESKISEAK